MDGQQQKMGNDNIDYQIRHVFLPPKLPQKDDEDVEKETCLIEAVLAALILFQEHISGEQQQEEERLEWSACIKMVENMLELRNRYGGGLEADKLEEKLRGMIDGGKLGVKKEKNGFLTLSPPLQLNLSLLPLEQNQKRKETKFLKFG